MSARKHQASAHRQQYYRHRHRAAIFCSACFSRPSFLAHDIARLKNMIEEVKKPARAAGDEIAAAMKSSSIVPSAKSIMAGRIKARIVRNRLFVSCFWHIKKSAACISLMAENKNPKCALSAPCGNISIISRGNFETRPSAAPSRGPNYIWPFGIIVGGQGVRINARASRFTPLTASSYGFARAGSPKYRGNIGSGSSWRYCAISVPSTCARRPEAWWCKLGHGQLIEAHSRGMAWWYGGARFYHRRGERRHSNII